MAYNLKLTAYIKLASDTIYQDLELNELLEHTVATPAEFMKNYYGVASGTPVSVTISTFTTVQMAVVKHESAAGNLTVTYKATGVVGTNTMVVAPGQLAILTGLDPAQAIVCSSSVGTISTRVVVIGT